MRAKHLKADEVGTTGMTLGGESNGINCTDCGMTVGS